MAGSAGTLDRMCRDAMTGSTTSTGSIVRHRRAMQELAALASLMLAAFGRYETEPIEQLPPIYNGAYMALYNAEVFCPPFILDPPNHDNCRQLRMVYVPANRRASIVRAEPVRRSAVSTSPGSSVPVGASR